MTLGSFRRAACAGRALWKTQGCYRHGASSGWPRGGKKLVGVVTRVANSRNITSSNSLDVTAP